MQMELTTKPIEEMNVPELRKECARRGIGSGVWRAGAGRDACLSALRGESKPADVPAPAGGPLEQAIAAAIAPLLKTQTTREEFDSLADEWATQADSLAKLAARVADIEENGAKAKEGALAASLVVFDASDVQLGSVRGLAHRQLPQIVQWVGADCPLWLWGGAGCGKTTIARQVAAALGLPVYVVPIDPMTTPGKLVGFRNMATGEYVPGVLLAPFRDGGLLFLDEVDTGDEGVLAALNSLLANDHYTFPDGTEVQRHPRFRVMAGANTKGTGPVAGYRARRALDAATLDRFAVLELTLDPGLEMAIACGDDHSESTPYKPGAPLAGDAARNASRRWVQYVQKVRGTDTIAKDVLVSQRASILGARAIRAGVPLGEVAECCLFKLVNADTKARILDRCGQP